MIAREFEAVDRSNSKKTVETDETSGARAHTGFKMKRDDVTGVVLCGGASRRMGSDKAELPAPGAGNGSLLEAAIARLDSVAGRVVLATGGEQRYIGLGRECVLDRLPDAGPLAGLAAALDALSGTWLCVLACDMPGIGPQVFPGLIATAVERDLDACLLETAAGIEPLCAVYRVTCGAAVNRALDSGKRKMTAFHGDGLQVGTLLASTAFGGDGCAENLNTRADYARVLEPQGPSDPEELSS